MTDSQISVVDAGNRAVSRRVMIDARAGDIFALLAGPRRHQEIDGSGTVRKASDEAPPRLAQGSKFTMKMKQYGVPYTLTSTVTAFESDRVIEWQHPLGHTWRWELLENATG